MRLLSPAKSWLPSFGCTDVQTTAAAAVASITRVPGARPKVAASGAVPPLVRLLESGSAEAQGHAAKALGSLAEDASVGFQVRNLRGEPSMPG